MKITVTQIRSQIRHQVQHKRIVKALGLGRIGKSRVHEDNPVVRGMIEKVRFLVKVEPFDSESVKQIMDRETIPAVSEKKKKVVRPAEVKAESVTMDAESKPKRKKKVAADIESVAVISEASESVSKE